MAHNKTIDKRMAVIKDSLLVMTAEQIEKLSVELEVYLKEHPQRQYIDNVLCLSDRRK